MKVASKLINFNVPENVKIRFDEYCQILGTTRSKVLNEMVEDFLIQNEKLVADRIARKQQLAELDQSSPTIMRFREFIQSQMQNPEEEGPPQFFTPEYD